MAAAVMSTGSAGVRLRTELLSVPRVVLVAAAVLTVTSNSKFSSGAGLETHTSRICPHPPSAMSTSLLPHSKYVCTGAILLIA